MKPIMSLKTAVYTSIYLGFFLLIHFVGVLDYFVIPVGREDVILDAALASPGLTFQVVFYVLTVVALNLGPLVMLLASMRVLEPGLRRIGLTQLSFFLILVLCLWTAILAFNKLYFPRSSFALLIPFESSRQLGWVGGVSLGVFVMLGVLPAVWKMATRLVDVARRLATRLVVGIMLAAGMVQPLYSRWMIPDVSTQQPDIIIIGMDSFSPQHMQRNPGALPRLEKLLEESTVFDNTLTPLARTFPAWTSILTANYPVHSGARFNLTAFDQVEAEVTLPRYLKAHGYTTIYAQDERKFNNIDERFGFDRIVGPKLGAAEFVLTNYSDHPLANLFLLTPWANQVFPFIALNRAAHIQYSPEDFVAAIEQALPKNRSEPLFLAAHFCLAHHPYAWRTHSAQGGPVGSSLIEQKHMRALGALDQQVDRLIQALKEVGRLENTILVMLSDHGEALAYKDGLWAKLEEPAKFREQYQVDRYTAFPVDSGFSGHGTNVLDRTQYHSMLAFRAYGKLQNKFPASRRDRLAALVDVTPTLVQALGMSYSEQVDGVDLMAAPPEHNTRVVPTETGIRFIALASIANIDEEALLEESKQYYRVDPVSALLTVKAERYADLVATKDMAFHTDDWMLTLLRKDNSPIFPRVALLVHKPSGMWTLGNDKSMIKRAPMALLRQTATTMYGKEIADFNQTWAFN
jgi:arylsulfatase A-like enzyme